MLKENYAEALNPTYTTTKNNFKSAPTPAREEKKTEEQKKPVSTNITPNTNNSVSASCILSGTIGTMFATSHTSSSFSAMTTNSVTTSNTSCANTSLSTDVTSSISATNTVNSVQTNAKSDETQRLLPGGDEPCCCLTC